MLKYVNDYKYKGGVKNVKYDRPYWRTLTINLFNDESMNILVVVRWPHCLWQSSAAMPLFPQLAAEGEADLVTNYMGGFTGFVAAWYLMFLLGSVFGKVNGGQWGGR